MVLCSLCTYKYSPIIALCGEQFIGNLEMWEASKRAWGEKTIPESWQQKLMLGVLGTWHILFQLTPCLKCFLNLLNPRLLLNSLKKNESHTFHSFPSIYKIIHVTLAVGDSKQLSHFCWTWKVSRGVSTRQGQKPSSEGKQVETSWLVSCAYQPCHSELEDLRKKKALAQVPSPLYSQVLRKLPHQ